MKNDRWAPRLAFSVEQPSNNEIRTWLGRVLIELHASSSTRPARSQPSHRTDRNSNTIEAATNAARVRCPGPLTAANRTMTERRWADSTPAAHGPTAQNGLKTCTKRKQAKSADGHITTKRNTRDAQTGLQRVCGRCALVLCIAPRGHAAVLRG